MKRTVVCVATTEHYQRGAQRLMHALTSQPSITLDYQVTEPWGCPPHSEIPYAFKAFAIKKAANEGVDLVLWADACILPIRSMEPLWEKIERDGYWFCRNGWTNYEWTADSAYPDLFPHELKALSMESVREQINRKIPHVVATSFGLNLRSEIGKAFLDEYFRLASETRAFCGPWINDTHLRLEVPNLARIDPGSEAYARCAPCGLSDVRGHRHDQTAASVIAWRLGMKLTDPPEIFAYPPGDERTILLADGAY